jgi:hypothetical protein
MYADSHLGHNFWPHIPDPDNQNNHPIHTLAHNPRINRVCRRQALWLLGATPVGTTPCRPTPRISLLQPHKAPPNRKEVTIKPCNINKKVTLLVSKTYI